jgi:hypothetical protein
MKFKPSAITLFSGGGLADIGLKAAGTFNDGSDRPSVVVNAG